MATVADKAIAYELGFSNAIVFLRLFKTHLVAPPQTSEGWEKSCNLP